MESNAGQALVSWTVRYQTAAGFECSLTLHGAAAGDVLPRADTALKWLVEHGAEPLVPEPAPVAAEEPAPEPEPDPAWCPIHQAQMKQHTANGQTWYSHKVGNEWCRGKAAK